MTAVKLLELNELLQTGVQADVSAVFGVVRVSGADARGFLHGQLTQDVAGLLETQTKLAGYCSAKGRLYAVLQIFAVGEDVFFVTRRELFDAFLKRLRMFVMRAKVLIEDVSNDFRVIGLAGESCLAAGVAQREGDVQRLGLLPAVVGGVSIAREWAVVPVGAAFDTAATHITPSSWQWLDIMAGLPHVETATYEAFVPQMINFDRIGGVNFKKGCYPGQEVVARSHYLGKLKKRMQVARLSFADDTAAQNAAASLVANTDVLTSADASPVGVVVAAAVNLLDSRLVDVLYEISLPALEDDAAVSFVGVDAVVTPLPLPYGLSDD